MKKLGFILVSFIVLVISFVAMTENNAKARQNEVNVQMKNVGDVSHRVRVITTKEIALTSPSSIGLDGFIQYCIPANTLIGTAYYNVVIQKSVHKQGLYKNVYENPSNGQLFEAKYENTYFVTNDSTLLMFPETNVIAKGYISKYYDMRNKSSNGAIRYTKVGSEDAYIIDSSLPFVTSNKGVIKATYPSTQFPDAGGSDQVRITFSLNFLKKSLSFGGTEIKGTLVNYKDNFVIPSNSSLDNTWNGVFQKRFDYKKYSSQNVVTAARKKTIYEPTIVRAGYWFVTDQAFSTKTVFKAYFTIMKENSFTKELATFSGSASVPISGNY